MTKKTMFGDVKVNLELTFDEIHAIRCALAIADVENDKHEFDFWSIYHKINEQTSAALQ